MDEASEPKPSAAAEAAEEEGGGELLAEAEAMVVEPPDDAAAATTPPPSPSSSPSASQEQQQQTTTAQAPLTEEEEALGEAVPMATEDGEAKDVGGKEDNDDDVVMLEEEASRTITANSSNREEDTPANCTRPTSSSTPPAAASPTAAAGTATGATVTTAVPTAVEEAAASMTLSSSSSISPLVSSSSASKAAAPSSPLPSLSPAAPKAATTTPSEPIVIDDEEDAALEHMKDSSSSSPSAAAASVPGVGGAAPAPSLSSSSTPSAPPAAVTLSSTEPDSEIRIASVTTLDSNRQKVAAADASSSSVSSAAEPQVDMNLKITSVTSLQDGASSTAIVAAAEGQVEENGLQISGAFSPADLQISGAFSLNADSSSSSSSRPTASFNPGRVSTAAGQPVQNGDTGTHARTDSWISQSASFPRNQKQTGVDSPSPATSLTKPPGQSAASSSSSGSQQQPRTVKVTCANCKKPLKKGQTAYQRKGSTHLFCSTTCLSAFSHKPAPKKSCTMCKKDITTMKGTIVAQVDSSEQFQEFCSTGCLGAYESKQNPPKSTVKTKCTVCGKLTEIRHEVSFKTVTHKICSDSCFNRYRMANGLIMNCCEQCGDYLPSRATANYFVLVDGKQKRFCCQNCIRDFKQAHSKLASCATCKTLIKTGDVLHSVGAGGTMASYCSVACMNKAKMPAVIAPTTQNAEPTCHYCKTKSLPQYQATLPEGNVLNFCSSQCVAKFQNAPTLQTTTTNGQTPVSTTNSSIQLKCNYCKGAFSLKPETLDWEDKVYQFCSKTCCEDYKKLHCIVTFCEYCQEEKTLHETVQISGVKRPFCSEGCKLLFKQDFVRRLGLKCVSCNHCNQLCKRGVTRQLGGMTRDFCSEACAKKFNDWYYKAARCDCCKVQGTLTESVQWRTEMKHFCDQQCLLRFYLQQNEPIMVTQKGPENTSLGFDMPSAKPGVVSQGSGVSPGGPGKDVKNKAVLCKPLTLTKATYCKPHMQSKLLQTDVDDGVKREYIPVPIPVPVYIPVPMNMYAQVTPSLFPMPLPVPVPVLLPTTPQGADQMVEGIGDPKNKADDATVDQVITEERKPDVKSVKVKREHGADRGQGESSCSSGSSSEEEEEEKYEPDLDLEIDFPQAPALDSILALEDDMGFSLPPVLAEEKEEPESRPQPRRKGHKRRAVEGENAQSSSPSSPCRPSADRRSEGKRRNLSLQARYGLNAWKRWAMSAPGQPDDTKGKDDPSAAAAVRSNSNMLSLSPAELSTALSQFIKEACRPSGDHYAPDSILYLCLGIQQHLRAKGRKDDLFSDPCYQKFGEELNKILKDWKPTVLPDGCLWGRVEEGSLWSSGHLGEESPAALLRSLVYLNTKYFGLRTADQHLRLSFANVYGPDTVHPVTKETSVCIRVPSIPQEHSLQTNSRKRKRKGEEEDEPDYEPDEGSGASTSHCPVKKHECRLYELYRSKCPSSLRERVDMFYMQPESNHSPDSPLWFTSNPLERSTLESLLARVLLAREIYTETPQQEEDEEQGRDGEGGGGE